MGFAPEKYKLIHFTRCIEAGIRLEETAKAPSPDIRILGVWVDSKLRRSPARAYGDLVYGGTALKYS
jgi:hypothetical protein